MLVGVVMLTVGIIWFGSGVDNTLRWVLILGGLVILAGLAVVSGVVGTGHGRDRARSRGARLSTRSAPVKPGGSGSSGP